MLRDVLITGSILFSFFAWLPHLLAADRVASGDFRNLRDARQRFLLSEDCKYLELHRVFSLLRTGGMISFHYYGDSLSPVTQLIRSSFWLPPESENPALLSLNPSAESFVVFLSPSAAGKLVNAMSKTPHGEQLDLAAIKKLIEDDPGFRTRLSSLSRDGLKYEGRYLDRFLKLVSSAFQAEGREVYPIHITEQLVLGMGWMNTGSDRKGLVEVYRGLSHCLTPAGEKKLLQAKTGADYSWTDYRNLTQKMAGLPVPKRIEYFQKNREDLAFLVYGKKRYEPDLVPSVAPTFVDLKHSKTQEAIIFRNTIETGILNFFLNLLAGGEGNRFETALLQEKLRQAGFKLHPVFESFLLKNPDPVLLNPAFAAREWTELLTGLEGVTYRHDHPGYEMVGGLTNLLKVADLLFYSTPIEKARAKTSSLQQLLELFSRPDRKLELREKSSKPPIYMAEILVNEVPTFGLKIAPDLFEFTALPREPQDWISGVGAEWVKKIKTPQDFKEELYSLVWLLEGPDRDLILKSLRRFRLESEYAFWLSLASTQTVDEKLSMIREFYDGQHDFQERLSRVPAENESAQVALMKMLFNLKYSYNRLIPFAKSSEFKQRAAIIAAIQVREHEFLSKFLAQGVSLRWKDSKGYNPLHLAARAGNWEAVQMFWDHDAELATSKNPTGESLIPLAIRAGEWRMVQKIVNAKPELARETDLEGMTPVLYAAGAGEWDVVSNLIQLTPASIADVDHDGSNLAHLAASSQNWEIFLLCAKLNPEVLYRKNNHDYSPLRIARIRGIPSQYVKALQLKTQELARPVR